MFPDKINTFVDLFGGGFNVGINVNADHIIYNDICEQVVGFLRYLQGSNIEEVLQKIDSYIDKYELTKENKEGYLQFREEYNTGIKNPKRLIENVEWNDEINIETCYVSRTYLTRHGAGKFPSECNKRFINEYMFDKTNVPNPFQDTLRYGTLDLGELYSRCSKDIGNFGDKKSIAITHCNEYDWDNDKLIELFKGWNIYYSDDETHNDVN